MTKRRFVEIVFVLLCVFAVVKHAFDPKPAQPQKPLPQPTQLDKPVPEPSLTAEQLQNGRKLYALIEAGDEYCPNLTQRWGIRAGVTYDLSLPGEFEKLDVAKRQWFDQFKKVGRQLACSELANSFGPGGEPHLFDLN